MKTEIQLEKCKTPFCVIHAAEKTAAIEEAAEKISMIDSEGKATILHGWDGDYCVPLKAGDIYRIYSMDKKVYAETRTETLLLQLRLYETEELVERCGLTDYIRISNTDIVNFTKVARLDMSLTGVIKVIFDNGNTTMVSRRYMSKIRSKLCIKK